MKTRSGIGWTFPASTLFLVLIGCAPIKATRTIAEATEHLQRATRANAHYLAVFEYEAAGLYLDKAKQQQALSQYQRSIYLATKALDCAQIAHLLATDRAQAKLKNQDIGEIKASKFSSVAVCRPGPKRANMLDAHLEPSAQGTPVLLRDAEPFDPGRLPKKEKLSAPTPVEAAESQPTVATPPKARKQEPDVKASNPVAPDANDNVVTDSAPKPKPKPRRVKKSRKPKKTKKRKSLSLDDEFWLEE